MRFVIYKNSFLATVVSLIGSACIVMAVMGLINKEIEVLPAIGMIAGGILLYWLGSVISKRKEARKKARAADVKNTSSDSAAPLANYKPVKGGLVFAAILLLIIVALGFAFANNISVHGPYVHDWNSEQVALIFMSILLFIGALRSRHTQESSVWFLIAFLLLALGSVDVFLVTYEKYGFGGYSDPLGIHYMMAFAPMVRGGAYLLLAIFSLCSMRGIKKALGGIVKVFWWLPCLVLIVAFAKWADDNYILAACDEAFSPKWVGLKHICREVAEALARILMIPATFIIGFSLQRFCKKPAVEAPAQEPVPRHSAPVPPAEPAQPKPAPQPQYTAPEPPRQPEPDSSANLHKELQAYQSLLDSGILTQEEYNQKIRELTRK